MDACPKCGRPQAAGADFCPQCGTGLARAEPIPGVAADPWAASLLQDMASNGLWLVVGYGGQRLWQRLRRRHRASTPSAEEAERAAIQRVRLATAGKVRRKEITILRTAVPLEGPAVVEVGVEGRVFGVEVARRNGRLEARIAETRR